LPDFRLWSEKNSELHWHDLVVSGIRQLVVEPGHELRDMTRKDRAAAEQKLVADLCEVYCTREMQLTEWERQTGKSAASFYRCLKKLPKAKRQPGTDRDAA
jgi:hypothetical protein